MIRALVLPLVLLAGPALAQTLAPPQGCAAFLTVQQSNCVVAHMFTCTSDEQGTVHSVFLYADGGDFIASAGPEKGWLRSVDAFAGTDNQAGPVTEPVSITDLIATGEDQFDFVMIGADGSQTRYLGSDRLTGTQSVIDGVTLRDVTTQMQATDLITGQELWRLTATGFLQEEQRLAFSGQTEWFAPDGDSTVDERPVEFILPGEPGFLATQALHGCGG